MTSREYINPADNGEGQEIGGELIRDPMGSGRIGVKHGALVFKVNDLTAPMRINVGGFDITWQQNVAGIIIGSLKLPITFRHVILWVRP